MVKNCMEITKSIFFALNSRGDMGVSQFFRQRDPPFPLLGEMGLKLTNQILKTAERITEELI